MTSAHGPGGIRMQCLELACTVSVTPAVTAVVVAIVTAMTAVWFTAEVVKHHSCWCSLGMTAVLQYFFCKTFTDLHVRPTPLLLGIRYGGR